MQHDIIDRLILLAINTQRRPTRSKYFTVSLSLYTRDIEGVPEIPKVGDVTRSRPPLT